MKERVLVVSPHGDDETLGCGGTLLKHRALGDDVYCLSITSMPLGEKYSKAVIDRRGKEIKAIEKGYGFKGHERLFIPTACVDTLTKGDLVGRIAKVIQQIKPTVIYLPNRSDIHSDHQLISAATLGAIKNFRAPFVKRVLMYEVISETEMAPPFAEAAFLPNVFIDISAYFENKLKLMKIYRSEVMKKNAPRSLEAIKALAVYRGSRIMKAYAEAFMLVFEQG